MSDTLIDLHVPLTDDRTELLGFISGCPGWAVYLSLGKLVDPDGTTMLSVRQRLLIRFAATAGRITVHETHHADPDGTSHPDVPTGRLEAAVNDQAHHAIVTQRLLATPPTVDQVRHILTTAPMPEPIPADHRPPPRGRPRRTGAGPGPTRPNSRWR
jgi:hypothetical protein